MISQPSKSNEEIIRWDYGVRTIHYLIVLSCIIIAYFESQCSYERDVKHRKFCLDDQQLEQYCVISNTLPMIV
ncbi:hypothetical protein MHIR_DE00654 [Candidatus Doolittlea endobia]|uniref:Uncharacterized protein n=1 Tax=Candidatus Doolittlea endobia TaxID=1778262 RepID=A0A143WTJ6_9ENTR|nr:hypothetical protein MHIR_DE00654 [Candidatus Doolittlea endobia]